MLNGRERSRRLKLTETMRFLLASGLFLFVVSSAEAEEAAQAQDCHSVEECVAIIRDFMIEPPPPANARLSSGINPRPIASSIERLQSFGGDSVAAVVPLLEHPNFNVRNRAGFVLSHFAVIEPVHAERLMRAHAEGVAWLHWPIARTGTDAALAFLWADFLADPNFSSNSQAFTALPSFGERLLPYLESELSRCRSRGQTEVCGGISRLLAPYDPAPAFAIRAWEEIASSPDAAMELREIAVSELVRLRHPLGLEVLLARLSAQADESDDGLSLEFLIDDVADYGQQAVRAGPLIANFLYRRDLPNVRAAAALAPGQIGYSDGVADLLAQSADFSDDWYLAYNVSESLGRLRTGREQLEALSRSHWYLPVRNNALRALNYLDGGGFARPGVDDDGDPPPEDLLWPLTGADFRHAGDLLQTVHSCTIERERMRYDLFGIDTVRWPQRRNGGGVHLELRSPSARQRRTFHGEYPQLASLDPRPLTIAVDFHGFMVAGTSFGEWGGAVYAIDRRGRVSRLVEGNALAAFKARDRLFVITGLSHLVMSTGDLWVIELQDGRPVVSRRIRLPLEPHGYDIAFRDTLVIGTERGDVAIRSDGALIDPQRIEGCN